MSDKEKAAIKYMRTVKPIKTILGLSSIAGPAYRRIFEAYKAGYDKGRTDAMTLQQRLADEKSDD